MKELHEIRKMLSDKGLNDLAYSLNTLITEAENNGSTDLSKIIMIAEQCRLKGHSDISVKCRKAVNALKTNKTEVNDIRQGKELFESMTKKTLNKIHLSSYTEKDIDKYFE